MEIELIGAGDDGIDLVDGDDEWGTDDWCDLLIEIGLLGKSIS